MNRLKDWCIGTVQRGLYALSTKHHRCKVCNEPCMYCVTFQGSSVDKQNYYKGSDIKKVRILQLKDEAVEVSTQTESLTSYLQLTGPHGTSDLPDLLVSSLSSREPLKAVAPPPPPPPLPPTLLASSTTSALNITKRKINSLKKCQSAGASAVGPKITVELLKNVRLRKPRDAKDVSHSNLHHSLKGGTSSTQPAVTLKVLQNVTLRKTQSIKNMDLGASVTNAETNGHFIKRPEDRVNVQHDLRRTHITRSPGGTPQSLKRRRQSAREHHSVICKQRRQTDMSCPELEPSGEETSEKAKEHLTTDTEKGDQDNCVGGAQEDGPKKKHR